MALTQNFKQAIGSTSTSGGVQPGQPMTPEQAKSWIGGTQPTAQAPTSTNPDLGDLTAKAQLAAGDKIVSSVTEGAKKIEPVTDKLMAGKMPNLKEAGTAALGAGEAALGTASGAVSGLFAPLSAGVEDIANHASDNAAVQKMSQSGFMDAIAKGEDAFHAWTAAHPELAKNLGDALNVGLAALGSKGAPEAPAKGIGPEDWKGPEGPDGGGPGGPDPVEAYQTRGMPKTTTDAVAKQSAATADEAKMTKIADDQYILDRYTKGISPKVAGKSKTSAQLDQYNNSAVSAIRDIAKNKESNKLTDLDGEEAGKLPETINQMRQAVEQGKARIFKQYDSMASQAADTGAKVDLKPVVKELSTITKSKIVKDLHPELAKYAANRAKILTKRGSYTTSEGQEAVQNLNRSLDAYYRNPSYETYSKASVDALIANKLREGLDSSIENATAPGYQSLKRLYGDYKAIEQDVTKRDLVHSRQTGGRGVSVSNVVSAEELIRGLATHNPAALMTAGAIKGIAIWRRYLTDPNRAVRQAFERADTGENPDLGTQSPDTPTPDPEDSKDSYTSSIDVNKSKVNSGDMAKLDQYSQKMYSGSDMKNSEKVPATPENAKGLGPLIETAQKAGSFKNFIKTLGAPKEDVSSLKRFWDYTKGMRGGKEGEKGFIKNPFADDGAEASKQNIINAIAEHYKVSPEEAGAMFNERMDAKLSGKEAAKSKIEAANKKMMVEGAKKYSEGDRVKGLIEPDKGKSGTVLRTNGGGVKVSWDDGQSDTFAHDEIQRARDMSPKETDRAFTKITDENSVDYNRKPTDLTDVSYEVPSKVAQKAEEMLPTIHMEEMHMDHITDKFGQDVPQHFILDTGNLGGGKRILVDTQGYDYVRYAAKMPDAK